MRLLLPYCIVALAVLTSLPGCQPNPVGQTAGPARKKEYVLGPSSILGPTTPLETATMELVSQLGWVQDIELGGHLPTVGPQDSVSIYIGKKKYRFANVHQLHRNIRQRWDSLKAAGAELDFDTTAQLIPGGR